VDGGSLGHIQRVEIRRPGDHGDTGHRASGATVGQGDEEALRKLLFTLLSASPLFPIGAH